MRIEILTNIAGTGDVVEGFRHRFALEPGMIANVEDELARKWIASGIAVAAPMPPAVAVVAETAALATPEKAARHRPIPRKRRS